MAKVQFDRRSTDGDFEFDIITSWDATFTTQEAYFTTRQCRASTSPPPTVLDNDLVTSTAADRLAAAGQKSLSTRKLEVKETVSEAGFVRRVCQIA